LVGRDFDDFGDDFGRPDAPAILVALNGSGGIWGAVNALAIAWENRKRVE